MLPECFMLPIVVTLFILLDVITGIAKAVVTKELCSEKLREGAFHKFSFIILICLAYLIDYSVAYVDLELPFLLVNPVCVYIVITEVISVVENVAQINPDLQGTKLLDLFRITSKDEKKED